MSSEKKFQAEQVLTTLVEVLHGSESDTARIAAAKILLERLAPKEDDEATRREAVERETALAEARGLLAEFTALKLAGLCQPRPLDQTGAAAAADAAAADDSAGLADLAGDSGPRLG